MKKIFLFSIVYATVLAFTACQSEDTASQLDGNGNTQKGLISFTVDAEQATTRVADGYVEYTTTNRPDNMGVFGYAGLASLSAVPTDGAANTIFSNQKVEYSDNAWTYSPAKYWAGWASLSPFDFFAYMPQANGATITQSGDAYTVSFPVTIADGVTTNETALICHTPYHTELVDQTIPFQMDQTLTGFRLEFRLGDKYDEIRDVTIKKVEVLTDDVNAITSGTVSRTYTRTIKDNVTSWSAGNISWSFTKNTAVEKKLQLGADADTIVLNDHSTYHKWNTNFFAIPVAGFTPTIRVTYDVTLNGTTDGSGKYKAGETTRTDVTSTIQLCNTNFAKYDETKAGSIGKITPIQIRIVPSYLYVLDEDDLDSGYIIIK